jgi:D-threo-aldose 1-dehydrogenase
MNPTAKRELGGSGVEVTVLGFGGGMLGEQYVRLTEADASATVEAAYQAGMNLFDTAPHYGHGLSEARTGHVLRQKPRESFVLSTKVGRYLAPPTKEAPLDLSPYLGGLAFNEVFDYTRDGTLRALDQSMARLGISSIDCVVIHDVDVWTHGTREVYREKFRETMDGCYPCLAELKAQKVIKAIGVGVNEVEVSIEFANAGDFDFFDLAGRYTLLEQGGLDDFLPLCLKKNIGIMLGGPYNSGILATGARPGANYNYKPAPPDVMERVSRIEAVCSRHAVPLAAAALQFPLGHAAVSTMIPGTSSARNVERNVKLMSHSIPAALWDELKAEKLLDERAPVPVQN